MNRLSGGLDAADEARVLDTDATKQKTCQTNQISKKRI